MKKEIAKLYCKQHNLPESLIIENDDNVSVLAQVITNPENPQIVCTAKDINDLISSVVQGLEKSCPETDIPMLSAMAKFPYEVKVHINNLLCQKAGSDYDIDKARCILVKIVDIPSFQAAAARKGVIFFGGAITEDGQSQYFYK